MSKNGRRNGVSFHCKDDRSALPGPVALTLSGTKPWGARGSNAKRTVYASLFNIIWLNERLLCFGTKRYQ